MQDELALLDRHAQLFGQAQAVAGAIEVLLALIQCVVRSRGLGSVHRHVGAPQQTVAVLRVGGSERDANARADARADRVEDEGCFEGAREPLGDRDGILGGGVHRHHRELVAAEADEDVAVAQRVTQPRSKLLENRIARRVAE